MQFLTNLKAVDRCQTPTNEKLIYFPANSCKLQKHLGNLKIRSLKSVQLGKTHALLQDVLVNIHFLRRVAQNRGFSRRSMQSLDRPTQYYTARVADI